MKKISISSIKNATKKQRLILLAAAASLGVLILGIGLGLGLDNENDTVSSGVGDNPSGDGGTNNPEPNTDKGDGEITLTKGTSYTFTEKDGEDGKKEVVVRFKENTTLEKIKTEVEILKSDLKDKTLVDLRLPFAIKTEFETTADDKTTIDVKKIKDKLGVDVEANKVGFIFYPSDDKEETKTYKDQNIVEVVLSPEATNVVKEKFKNNRIKEVNWDELVKLEKIGVDSFGINDLEGELNLSKLVKLKIIGGYAFQQNKLKGTLTLPPNIEEIGDYSFSSFDDDRVGRGINKISGTLKLPKKLKKIGINAFASMEISKVDWSEAESLEEIRDSAFSGNKITSLNFTKTSLPKLRLISSSAFKYNSGELLEGTVELPINLVTIEVDAIKVKDGTKIYVSTNTIKINKNSFEFEGDITILKYTQTN